MKRNEFDEWVRSMQPEPEGIPVKYAVHTGEQPVDTTLELVAEHNRLDPDILEDLLRQYEGDLNLALLAAVNEKNETQFWNSMRAQFCSDFLMNHHPRRFMENHGRLCEAREWIRRQLSCGSACGNSVILQRSQLDLLRYCMPGKVYASPEELALWKALEKAAEPDRKLTAEERDCLVRWLGAADVETLLSMRENLLLTPEAVRKLLALEGRMTRKENAGQYVRLCANEKLPDTRVE